MKDVPLGVGKQLFRVFKALKFFDFVIFGFSIASFLVIMGLALQLSASASEVTIKAGDNRYIYRLEKDLEFDVAGPLGLTHIEIKNKAVRVVDSPCRDKICIHSGWLNSGGQWTACLPNRVFLSINAGNSDSVDASTY